MVGKAEKETILARRKRIADEASRAFATQLCEHLQSAIGVHFPYNTVRILARKNMMKAIERAFERPHTRKNKEVIDEG